MPAQRSLFEHQPFDVVPEPGREGPRLWVRRMVIWKTADEIIRDVRLRQGLNVIWSPDAGVLGSAPIGHGGGKTTFCRLLRYCLGEDSFAPVGQRSRIWDSLPEGRVGAEIMIEGTCWAVVRRFDSTDRDIVVAKAESLQYAVSEGASKTDFMRLRQHLTEAIIGDAVRLMPASIGSERSWEALLAWATRDQECRFSHQFDWRDPHTDSRSPVRGRSQEDMLTIVRALIGALSVRELETRKEESGLADAVSSLRSELGRLEWQIQRTSSAIRQSLQPTNSISTPDLDAPVLKSIAVERYTNLLKLPPGSPVELDLARRQRDIARTELRTLEDSLRDAVVRADEKDKSLSFIRAELPIASAVMVAGQNPICPICKVPLDTALREGCGLATECDLEELQQRVARLEDERRDEEQELARLRDMQGPLKADIAMSTQKLQGLDRTVAALEASILESSNQARVAQRNIDEADRFAGLVAERNSTASSIRENEAKLTKTREILAAHRDSAADIISDLSRKFDAVMRELVPADITGKVVLDGLGMQLKVELGGERSTAAIDSWKVVVFDLATLVMTIEGHTRLSGFLLHDSPREADLGMSLYARLFNFARNLEQFGPSPLFQYIVTTTTEPPPEFRQEPWLCLTLSGAPAEERLLRADL
jgi:hypothetical protein